MNCEYGGKPEVVELYLAGRLPDDEAARFELHYFECDTCLTSVQTGQAIQAAGEQPAKSKVLSMPARAATPAGRPRWLYGLAAAAALILGTFVAWRAFVTEPAPKTVLVVKTAPPAESPANPSDRLAELQPSQAPTPADEELVAMNRLEAVEPLPYKGSVLRGAGEDSAELFRKAMASYTAHDYARAVRNLSAIPVGIPGSGKPEEHVTDAGVQLYLGVSRLILNQNGGAIEALRRSVDYGDTPYLESAGYYLSKGLIRQKNYSEAEAQLRQTIALNGDRQNAARQLLADLEHAQASELHSSAPR